MVRNSFSYPASNASLPFSTQSRRLVHIKRMLMAKVRRKAQSERCSPGTWMARTAVIFLLVTMASHFLTSPKLWIVLTLIAVNITSAIFFLCCVSGVSTHVCTHMPRSKEGLYCVDRRRMLHSGLLFTIVATLIFILAYITVVTAGHGFNYKF